MVEKDFNSNVSFGDSGEYGEKTPSLKEIALIHIRKISGITCQELTKGYWQEKPLKVGTGIAITRVYHEDTRMAYINAIDFLIDIVYAYSDDTFRSYINEIDNEEKITELSVDEKLKKRRVMFREMNKMFERMNFFDLSDSFIDDGGV